MYLHSWPNNSTAFGLVQPVPPLMPEWWPNEWARAPARSSSAKVNRALLVNTSPEYSYFLWGSFRI